MQDTSTLETLYSALIQGGATIVAVLGAFLLTFGPAQRTAGAQLRRQITRTSAEVDRLTHTVQEFEKTLHDIKESSPLRRILTGATTLDEAKTEIEELQRHLQELRQSNQQLNEAAQSQIDSSEAQLRHIFDFYDAAIALLIVIYFCIINPSIMLAWLTTDSQPFYRSLFAVSGYAWALLFVVNVVKKTFAPPDDPITQEDTGLGSDQHQLRRRSDGFQRVIAIALVFSALGSIATGIAPWPFSRTDTPASPDTSRSASPVPIASPPALPSNPGVSLGLPAVDSD